jgi:hypothetical protein
MYLILNTLYVSFYNICLFLYFRTLLNRLASEHANQCHEIELENEVLSWLIEELDKAEWEKRKSDSNIYLLVFYFKSYERNIAIQKY